jgi:hypothetical protein
MENNFRAPSRDVREPHDRDLEEAHAALGEEQLELQAL